MHVGALARAILRDPRHHPWLSTTKTHVGVALTQRKDDDKPVVIAYWSRALNSAERSYSSQEREMLAICGACTAFRHYIMGAHLKVRIFSSNSPLPGAHFARSLVCTVPAIPMGEW